MYPFPLFPKEVVYTIAVFALFRERPPGLIQHVLTVPVFWSWALLLPRLPPSSRSLRLFPWASILLHVPLGICLHLLPAAPLPPVTHSTCFYSTGVHTPISGSGDRPRQEGCHGGVVHSPEKKKNTRDHHRKKIFWRTFLASKKNIPGWWWIHKPY